MIWYEQFMSYLVAAAFTTIRVGAIFFSLPIFGKDVITGLGRAGLIIGFSLLVMPVTYTSMIEMWPISGWIADTWFGRYKVRC